MIDSQLRNKTLSEIKRTGNIYKNHSSLSGADQGEVDSNKLEISGDSNCGEFRSKKIFYFKKNLFFSPINSRTVLEFRYFVLTLYAASVK